LDPNNTKTNEKTPKNASKSATKSKKKARHSAEVSDVNSSGLFGNQSVISRGSHANNDGGATNRSAARRRVKKNQVKSQLELAEEFI
jgi:hypothetical protein